MFINFYSVNGNIEKKGNYMQLYGYSEYIKKYFELKIIKCDNLNIGYLLDVRSDEQNLIVKSDRFFYCITTTFFSKFIEPKICLNFNYNKYNIPVNVYIAMTGLLTVNL